MWLIGSNPRNPASLTALHFSIVVPGTPTVANMIAFLMPRFLAGVSDFFSSSAKTPGVNAAKAAALPPTLIKLRREQDEFMYLFVSGRCDGAKEKSIQCSVF